MVSRAVTAVIYGIGAGIVVYLLVLVVSALLPAVKIDARFWATIAGVLTFLYMMVSGPERPFRA